MSEALTPCPHDRGARFSFQSGGPVCVRCGAEMTRAAPGVQRCTRPPAGWYCTREPGHDGPCPARPVDGATYVIHAGICAVHGIVDVQPHGAVYRCVVCDAVSLLLGDARKLVERIQTADRTDARILPAETLADYHQWAERHPSGFAGEAVRRLLDHIDALAR